MRLIIHLSIKHLFVRKTKTFLIGSIILFGTLFMVLGDALVESMISSMSNSIVSSITGNIQIYSSQTDEKLSVVGNMDSNFPELPSIKDCRAMGELLKKKIANIKAVVPQGINFALVNPGNILDVKLRELREKVKKGEARNLPEIEGLKGHITTIIRDISSNYENRIGQAMQVDNDEQTTDRQSMARALAPNFWQTFDEHPYDNLEFMENRLAPLISDDTMLYFFYIGTPPDEFEQNFPLFQIVKGERIPKGKQGLLLNESFYESQVKHRIARRLDEIKKLIEKENLNIRDSKKIKDLITQNREQILEIKNQMGPLDVKRLSEALVKEEIVKIETVKGAAANNSTGPVDSIDNLLSAFFDMNDDNFLQRYNFFYREIAPKIILYRIKIGEFLPLTSLGRSGSTTSVKLKVYGTFKLKNFENSPLIGNYSLMDLVSFRELLGEMGKEKRADMESLTREIDQSISSATSIDDLFSKKAKVVTKVNVNKVTPVAKTTATPPERLQLEEKESCLNAAIILKDQSESAMKKVLQEINQLSKSLDLKIQAVNWQEAAGLLGQLFFVFKLFLYIFIAIISVVAIFIIMNLQVMAAMERTKEIGVMRAIGAPGPFVVKLMLVESIITTNFFGVVGALIGMFLVYIFGRIGIPANGDIMTFLFSGPYLYPTTTWFSLLKIMIILNIVGLLAAIYPALFAAKITPLRAMSHEI
ncbi:MAG: ABC transporter permease [Oligoflexia bacterium]|nr:ABC transporter permease [Oligoflexia bacterium]